uniref:Uncharacterized protein n=1 Tax=Tanacetum cinerariifolium TaxID=118510 RepID=A0A699Q755_TANCI|nr:hypothetical protein [Tanacetum cinerariifolium]
MDTTIDQHVAMDEALVPTAQRLKIGRSNFCLLSDIKSKESTLQLVYDATATVHYHSIQFKMDNKHIVDLELFRNILHICPRVHGQSFAETPFEEEILAATVHHLAIRFKKDNKKHILNLESFMDMLNICPKVHGQSFDEPAFEEEILAFIRFLGHNAAIRMLTDVNINKLYQPWRSFTTIINKCLTGKSSGYDSLRLSQAQIL